MDRTRYFTLLCFLLFGMLCDYTEGDGLIASFYGASFTRLPVMDASSETNVSFRFRTSQDNGLLFMAAGKTDYCVVEMKHGVPSVRIDLGSGRASVMSSRESLNDLQWHELKIERRKTVFTLYIDGHSVGTGSTPGTLKELNIKSIFLGGTGNTDNQQVGNFRSYRGCLQDVEFNSYDVFYLIKERSEQNDLRGVTWGCNEEFNATSDDPISFLYDYSFVTFPPFTARTTGKMSFSMKTKTKTAIVVYSSGRRPQSDYVALEILDGKLCLSIDKGAGRMSVKTEDNINDGKWHAIQVTIEAGRISLVMDTKGVSTRTSYGENRFLDLYGTLSVGGVGFSARASAERLRIPSIVNNDRGGSMRGCIRNFKMNDKLLGFRDVMVTQDVKAGCVWKFPCTSDPCEEKGQCVEIGFDQYRCKCQGVDCPSATEGERESDRPPKAKQFLRLNDVYVEEGGSVHINTHHIFIHGNLRALHMHDEDAVFTIRRFPTFGTIRVSNNDGQSDRFTYADLKNQRLFYTHGGAEGGPDFVTLLLQFQLPDGISVPEKFQKDYSIKLYIMIEDVNDRPRLILPKDDTIEMVEKTDILITNDLINVIDDDPTTDIIYTIEYPDGYTTGYFEMGREGVTGARGWLRSFSQDAIDRGRITFVHQGNKNQQIRIQASDGKEFTEPKMLKIKAVPLDIRQVYNTGIHIAPGNVAIISAQNLSFTTNAKNKIIDLTYRLEHVPTYGEIQRKLYNTGQWMAVSIFSQEDVDNGRIRYVNKRTGYIDTDRFTFNVSAFDRQTVKYEFLIKIESVDLKLIANETLLLKDITHAKITKDNLMAECTNPRFTEDDIMFKIMETPEEGSLYKITENENRKSKTKLRVGSTFSQNDIKAGRIMYRLKERYLTPRYDWFDFRIQVPGTSTASYRFAIDYKPSKTRLQVVNEVLVDVEEGSDKQITQDDLFVKSSDTDNFEYVVYQKPLHGYINFKDPISMNIEEYNITTFTNYNITEGKVYYQHDDSEKFDDLITFEVSPILPDNMTTMKEGSRIYIQFKIQITPVNDNEPVQVADGVFHVAGKSWRPILPENLLFHDPDMDTDDDDLTYSWDHIENGRIVLTENLYKVVRNFTQRDIQKGRLSFRHSVGNYSVSKITVSDGYFTVSTDFEVIAADPFFRLVWENNRNFTVERGKNFTIPDDIFHLETNMEIGPRNIDILVSGRPKYGKICNHSQPVDRFTWEDLRMNDIFFVSEDGLEVEDDVFELMAEINMIQERSYASFDVKVTVDSSKLPLELTHSKLLQVREGGRRAISSSYLKVSHIAYPPDQIKYTVTMRPTEGILRFRNTGRKDYLKSFTQRDIDDGRLIYKPKEKNRYTEATDMFIFDVTNGYNTLRAQHFNIKIMPDFIPISANQINVKEGDTVRLHGNNIKIGKPYDGHRVDIMVIKKPTHGSVDATYSRGVLVYIFKTGSLTSKKISYHHDDSDVTRDEFLVMALKPDSGKHSKVLRIPVHVRPVNDEEPMVKINKKMQVWMKTKSVITDAYMKTIDPDTTNRHLVYTISESWGCTLEYANNPDESITSFTQWDIDNERVILAAKGNIERPAFNFVVSDGKHQTSIERFNTHARPLDLHIINQMLEAYPSTTRSVTPRYLKVSTKDPNSADYTVFTIIKKPRRGKLSKLIDNIYHDLKEGDTFTQKDVDASRLSYEHEKPMRGDRWADRDYFIFTVNCGEEKRQNITFSISISYGNINEYNKRQIMSKQDKIILLEGNIKAVPVLFEIRDLKRRLSQAGFNINKLYYEVIEMPKHGSLTVKGKEEITGRLTFTQQELKQDKVEYHHDNSDTTEDMFRYAIRMEQGLHQTNGKLETTPMPTSTEGCKVYVHIRPINDRSFELLTQTSVLHVIQGIPANITERHLLTRDPDTSPENIKYRITNPSVNGHVVLRGAHVEETQMISQANVSAGVVAFIPDNYTLPGIITFTVTDGSHKEMEGQIDVNVTRQTLRLNKSPKVELIQGHPSVILTRKHLDVVTNGIRANVWYNITSRARNGEIVVQGEFRSYFYQSDIDNGDVIYVQTDFHVSEDSINFDLIGDYETVAGQTLDILVVPNVKISTFNVETEDSGFELSLIVLDASPLADMSNSTPVYTLTQEPTYGQLVKFVPEKGRGRSRRQAPLVANENIVSAKVGSFSHEEVKNKEIRYVANKDELARVDGKNVNDSFHFKLTTPGVSTQPADGSLHFTVHVPHVPTPTPTRPPRFNGPTTSKRAIPTAPPVAPATRSPGRVQGRISNDHLIIVILVCVISLLAIVIFIIVKCFKSRARKRRIKKMIEQSQVAVIPGEVHRSSQSSTDQPVITHDGRVVTFSDPAVTQRVPIPNTDYPPTPPPPKFPPRSPDLLRTEVSKTVPSLKVTPMIESSDIDTPNGTLRSGSDQQVTFGWETIDPELLEHCRTTNPILHKNKYWV